ncbi:hypothetical protein ABEB36_009429 [Hypothenemus hampei]|uniref:MADF domain-containing protein n=1 Tax=Hypothenemus hampei TaxID=57062 RepID=A0ABD1EJ91_HYPHA
MWNSLKDKYTRERKKLRTVSSGSEVQDYNKWSYYEDMSFLNDYIQERRKTTTNISANISSELKDIEEENYEVFEGNSVLS